MAVDRQGESRRGVAQALGDDMDRDAGLEQQRGVCVTQVVESDRRHARLADEPVEAVRHVVRVQW